MSEDSGKASGRILNFAHIEKTAGTTLRFLLEDHFDHREVFDGYFKWLMTGKAISSSHKLYRTHIPDLLQRLGAAAICVDDLTVLRDPIDRAASSYLHWIRERRSFDLDLAKREKLISSEFARYLRGSPSEVFRASCAPHMPRDYQTRWLAAAGAFEPLDPWVGDAAPLDDAKRYLKSCRWIGRVEHMREDLLALHLEMGWRPANLGRRENVREASQRVELTDADRASLQVSHPADMQLLAWAEEEIAERLKNRMASLSQSLDAAAVKGAWGEYSALPSPTRQSVPSSALVEACERVYLSGRLSRKPGAGATVFGAASALDGDGWQRREYTDDGSVIPYRWSGPGPLSDFDVPVVAPKGGILRIHVIAWQTPKPLILRGYANGQAMGEAKMMPASEGGLVWMAEFPPVDPSLGFVRFSLEVPSTVRLCDFADTPDRREVGFAYRQVSVRPFH